MDIKVLRTGTQNVGAAIGMVAFLVIAVYLALMLSAFVFGIFLILLQHDVSFINDIMATATCVIDLLWHGLAIVMLAWFCVHSLVTLAARRT